MNRSPTYIHFRSQWQVLGSDSPGQFFERKDFQNLLNLINEESAPADFDDFTYRNGRCEMGKLRGVNSQGGPAFSKLVYARDQLTVVEEWADISAEDFIHKFISILDIWFRCFPQTAIVAQNCCLRALIQPINFQDSRKFLGDNILQITDAMTDKFELMPFKIGFTGTWLRQLNSNQQIVIDATVNSWKDNRSVWLQVNGNSPMTPPINATNSGESGGPFLHCKHFLENELVDFLNEYDLKR